MHCRHYLSLHTHHPRLLAGTVLLKEDCEDPWRGCLPGLRDLGYIQIMRELVEGFRLTGIEKVTLIRDRKTGKRRLLPRCPLVLLV